MRALLAASLLVLAGCASQAPGTFVPNERNWPRGAQHVVLGHPVTLPEDVTPNEAAQLLVAVREHVASFSHERATPRPIAIGVTSKPYFPCANLSGDYEGCFCIDGNGTPSILVSRGARNEIPWLYHELFHYVFAPIDPEHRDPRWFYVNQRGEDIARELSEGRR